MPYRMRYKVFVDYVAAGTGLGQSVTIGPGAAVDIGPGGQIFPFFQLVQPSSNTFTNTDVVNMLTAMVADLTAQMDAVPTQTKIQNAATWSAIPPPSGA